MIFSLYSFFSSFKSQALYDITTGVPRLLSKIEAFSEVYWMDIRHGQIAASDKAGKVKEGKAEKARTSILIYLVGCAYQHRR